MPIATTNCDAISDAVSFSTARPVARSSDTFSLDPATSPMYPSATSSTKRSSTIWLVEMEPSTSGPANSPATR